MSKSLPEVMHKWAMRNQYSSWSRYPRHEAESESWAVDAETLEDASVMASELATIAKRMANWHSRIDPERRAKLKAIFLYDKTGEGEVIAEKNGEEIRFLFDSKETARRQCGSGVSDSRHSAMTRASWSDEYLEGIFDAWRCLCGRTHGSSEEHTAFGKYYEELSRLKERAAFRLAQEIVANAGWSKLSDVRGLAEELLTLAEADLTADEIKRRMATVKSKRHFRRVCEWSGLSPPPPSKCTASEAMGLKGFPGVYFCYRAGACVYVGRSKNIPKRLKSHHVVVPTDDLSWIECSPTDSFWNEFFYIGLMRPPLNFGVYILDASTSR